VNSRQVHNLAAEFAPPGAIVVGAAVVVVSGTWLYYNI
jgi:hypothetical protein